MYFEGFWSISDSRFPKVTDIRSVLAKHIVVYQQEMELAWSSVYDCLDVVAIIIKL